MRRAVAAHRGSLDEALLSNAFAWMRKAADDRLDGMVALLQKAGRSASIPKRSRAGGLGAKKYTGGKAASVFSRDGRKTLLKKCRARAVWHLCKHDVCAETWQERLQRGGARATSPTARRRLTWWKAAVERGGVHAREGAGAGRRPTRTVAHGAPPFLSLKLWARGRSCSCTPPRRLAAAAAAAAAVTRRRPTRRGPRRRPCRRCSRRTRSAGTRCCRRPRPARCMFAVLLNFDVDFLDASRSPASCGIVTHTGSRIALCGSVQACEHPGSAARMGGGVPGGPSAAARGRRSVGARGAAPDPRVGSV